MPNHRETIVIESRIKCENQMGSQNSVPKMRVFALSKYSFRGVNSEDSRRSWRQYLKEFAVLVY